MVVGARYATCLLSCTSLKAARSATSVFPYPTSPQISRSMILVLSISLLASSMAASWGRTCSYFVVFVLEERHSCPSISPITESRWMLCSSLVWPYSLICSFFLVSVFSLLLFSFSAIVYPLSDPGLSFCIMQNLICKLWHSADSITGKEKIYTDF